MKKLLVLSVLVGLMALPMFASDITFGGDMTYAFIGDFGDTFNDTQTVTVDIKGTVDDYNSLVIEIDALAAGGVGSPDRAVVTTDVGMWLGLPVGLSVTWGWDDPDVNEFQGVSAYSNEEVLDVSNGDDWMLNFLLSASFFEVELAFTPGIAGGATNGEILAGVAVKEPIPGMNAELYYWQGDVAAVDVYDEGWILFDAGYAGDFGGFGLAAGAGFAYPLLDTNDWNFGVGLSGTYDMATVTVGIDGNETDTLSGLSASAVVAPIDMLDIYAGLAYDMAGSELEEVDLGINAHVGAVEVYLGYLIDGDSVGVAGDNFNAPPGLAGDTSGMYIKFDVNY
jgi:hypothetical protein